MATIAAGSSVTGFVPNAQTITFTPGSGGRISFNGRNQDGSAITPREIYSETAIALASGATFSAEAIGNDGTYTDIQSSVSGGGGSWGSITGTLSNQTDLQTALSAKQASLVSGTNIKTVNGSSIVGSGDLSVALNTTVTLEHLPSTTVWAATLTPASYVSRFGFSTNVAIVVTVAGVTSPAANIQIQYSNDAGVSVASGPTTIGTITGNGTQTININPLTMPGAQFKVLINSGTGTGGTAGINVTLS